MNENSDSNFDGALLNLQHVHQFVEDNINDYKDSYPRLIYDIIITKTFRWFIGIAGIAAMLAVYAKTQSLLLSISQIFGPAFFVATPYLSRSVGPKTRLIFVNQLSYLWLPTWIFQTYLYYALSLQDMYEIGLVQFTFTMIWMFTFHSKYSVSFTASAIISVVYLVIIGSIDNTFISGKSLPSYINYIAVGAFLNSVLLGLVKYKFYASKKRQEVDSILECTPQGIFRLYCDKNNEITISVARSKAFSQIFGHEHDGSTINFTHFLRQCSVSEIALSNTVSLIQACLGEDSLSFELNEKSFPRDLTIRKDGRDKTLTINWASMKRASDGIVNGILVSISDVTELKVIALENESIKQRQTRLIQLTNAGRDISLRFFWASRDQLSQVRSILLGEVTKNALEKIFILVHSIKGTSLSLGFKNLADLAHEFETQLAIFRSEAVIASERDKMIDSCEIVALHIDYYIGVMENDLFWTRGDLEKLEIDNSDLDFIIDSNKTIFQRILAERPESLLSKALHQNYPVLSEVVEKVFSRLTRTANALQKPLPYLRVKGEKIRLLPNTVEIFESSFTHILNNSLDHGLEAASLREANGKNELGCITIELTEEDQGIIITCTDDGRGIDIRELRTKAKRRGLREAEYSDSEVAGLILSSGFSTKDSVTQISGWGVGLSAVLDSFRKLGGNVEIDLSRSRGLGQFDFVLKIILPKDSIYIPEKPDFQQIGEVPRGLSVVGETMEPLCSSPPAFKTVS